MCEKRDFLFRFVDATIRNHILLDDEALYSTTDQLTADKITKDVLKFVPQMSVITDATACIGGNTYSFAKHFDCVLAFEKDPHRVKLLRHNMAVLGIDNVRVMKGDALFLCQQQHQHLIFIDPPWGGPDYKRLPRVNLFISGMPLSEFCGQVSKHTQYIALKAPVNFNETEFINDTSPFLTLMHRNMQLRKMHLYIFKVNDT
jgi:tRNA G37 N-methylase Trm5